MQMESWAELANRASLTRIFQTPEYAAWRSLRESEDARYIGLCMPRFPRRLPYGARTEPVEAFDFEEDVEGPNASHHLWANAAYAMAANIVRAFRLYGWCVRIRGVDTGGAVDGLPILTFPTADGDVDRRCSTESGAERAPRSGIGAEWLHSALSTARAPNTPRSSARPRCRNRRNSKIRRRPPMPISQPGCRTCSPVAASRIT